MKHKLIFLLMIFTGLVSAQAPKLINYQGIARGNDGAPIVNEDLGIKFEILRGSITGSVVYNEVQTVNTNSLGLVLTQIGKSGNLAVINWQNGPYYLRVSIDVQGGTNYESLGTQEIMSVPYSMYAQTVPGNYDPSTNKLDIGGNTFTLTSAPITTITTQGVATVSNSATNNFVITVPASSISVTSTLGAPGVSTTGVNAFNINIPTVATSTVRGAGAAVVSPTTGSNFTVTVPQTSLVQSGAAQITSSGTNTFNVHVPQTQLTPSGAAQITSSGTNSFNVNVPQTQLNQSGAAQITSGGTNTFNVHVPQTQLNQSGAAQITSGGTNTFNVHVPQTQLTQSGAAQVTSGGTNTFNVHVPQTNVVVTSTSGVVAFNSPGTNSFNINVPSPTVQATGLATSTSAGNLHTINVPLLTYAQSTGILSSGSNGVNITPTVGLNGVTLNVGPAANAVNLAAISPWRQSSNTVTLATLTDRVGLGTNAPTENLQVQSTTSSSLSILSGNTNVSSLMFGTGSSHGSARLNYDNSNGTMSLWSNNVADRMYIDGTGNTGIGTNAPFAKLDILGNLRVNTGTSIDKIMLGNVGGVNSGQTGIYNNGGNLGFSVYKAGAPATIFGTTDAYDAMYIEHTTGRVGLGTNAPGENLQINSVNSASMSLVSQGGSSQIFFGQPSNHASGRVSYNVINNEMHLATNNTSRIFINSAGNVGLSNTNPGTRLEVTGDISIPIGNRVVFGTQSSGAGTGEFIQNTTSGLQINTGSLPRVSVTTGGQVGIGTTSPSASLHINGTIRMGSETTAPNYPLNGGMIIRRVFNNSLVAGNVVASTPDVILERDGTNGGFRVNRVGTSTLLVCNCTAVTSANLVLGRTLNNLAAGVTQLYNNTENIVFLHCIFGDPYFNATQHTTEITITRQHTDYFWVGTINSTFNQ